MFYFPAAQKTGGLSISGLSRVSGSTTDDVSDVSDEEHNEERTVLAHSRACFESSNTLGRRCNIDRRAAPNSSCHCFSREGCPPSACNSSFFRGNVELRVCVIIERGFVASAVVGYRVIFVRTPAVRWCRCFCQGRRRLWHGRVLPHVFYPMCLLVCSRVLLLFCLFF